MPSHIAYELEKDRVRDLLSEALGLIQGGGSVLRFAEPSQGSRLAGQGEGRAVAVAHVPVDRQRFIEERERFVALPLGHPQIAQRSQRVGFPKPVADLPIQGQSLVVSLLRSRKVIPPQTQIAQRSQGVGFPTAVLRRTSGGEAEFGGKASFFQAVEEEGHEAGGLAEPGSGRRLLARGNVLQGRDGIREFHGCGHAFDQR